MMANPKKSVLWLLLSFILTAIYIGASAQSYDKRWDVVNGYVNLVASDSDYTYVAGNFGYAGKYCRGGTTLNLSSASINYGWPIIEGTVYDVLPDGTGGWYIGGEFKKVGGYTINNIAHLKADKTLDLNWKPEANRMVLTMKIHGNDMFIGGYFDTVGGLKRTGIAKIDILTAKTNSTWRADLGGYLYSRASRLEISGNDLYVAGSFRYIGTKTRQNFARIDVTTGIADTNWKPYLNGNVIDIVSFDGDVFLGGFFYQFGAEYIRDFVKIDKNTRDFDVSWKHDTINGSITSIYIDSSNIYVGGGFTMVANHPVNYIARFSRITGKADTAWHPNPNYPSMTRIYSITAFGNDIFFGGVFNTVNGRLRTSLAKVSMTDGSLDSNWRSLLGLDNNNIPNVNRLAVFGNELFVGGAFNSIGGLIRKNIARFDNKTGRLDPNWYPEVNEPIYAFCLTDDYVYIAGKFTEVNHIGRKYLVRLKKSDGSVDLTWHPDLEFDEYTNPAFLKIVANSLSVYFVGNFYRINGIDVYSTLVKVDAFSGALDADWSPNPGNDVFDLKLRNNFLYVVGRFTSICSSQHNYITRLDTASGNVDPSWTVEADNNVNSINFHNGNIYFGGYFHFIGGKVRNCIAKINETTLKVDSIWNPNIDLPVYSIDFLGGKIMAGGLFKKVGGQTMKNFAALNNTDGKLIPGWDLNIVSDDLNNIGISNIAVFDNSIAICGEFRSFLDYKISSFAVFSDKLSQTISFPSIPLKHTDDNDFNPGATASSALNVYYTLSDTSIAQSVMGFIHIKKAGTCRIVAHQDGNSEYLPADTVGQQLVISNITSFEEPDYSFVKIYPNPASGVIHFDSEQRIESIEIIDCMGRSLIHYDKVSETSYSLDVSAFSNGIYLVRITGNQGSQIIKIGLNK
jgi:hypothetical protein